MNKGTLIGKRVTKLSLAVKVVDKQTMQSLGPMECSVFLEEEPARPTFNRDGYFLFMDLNAEKYSITANADNYLTATISDKLIGTLDPLAPLVTIELQRTQI